MKPSVKIARILAEKRLDQTAVAKAIDVGYSTFRTYLDRRCPTIPRADVAIRLARFLKVDVAWLFEDSAPRPMPAMQSEPPIEIHPWPPNGLTWAELQQAIGEYITRRASQRLAALEAGGVAGDGLNVSDDAATSTHGGKHEQGA